MRLIVFIVVFAIFLGFIVLNLDHKCDISFGFKAFKDVPIFLSILTSFVFGMLVTVPLLLSRGRASKKEKPPKPGKNDKKQKEEPGIEVINKNDSPYGID